MSAFKDWTLNQAEAHNARVRHNSQIAKTQNDRAVKTDRAVSSAEPEPPVCHDALGQAPGKEAHTGRCRVSITSRRVRLLDPDNLCPKYFIDALRYSGIIKNDRLEDIELLTRQVQVLSRTDEGTEILVEGIA